MPAESDGAATPRPTRGGRIATAVLLGVALAAHLGLIAVFAPPRLMFSANPVSTIDYSLHVYQVDRARRAFQGFGKLWSYDPQTLAGQPAGAIEDLSSKSVELFVIALARLGVEPMRAFNLYILLVHLLVPFCAFAAARLFRLSARDAAIATLLWVLLWSFDSFLHWAWFCGMISWSFASLLAVLFVALLWRTLEDPPRLLACAALPPLGALLLLVHPYAALIVVVPSAALYLRALLQRRLRALQHVTVLLTVAGALATSLIWLPVALRFWHHVMDSQNFLRPGPATLLTDFLDLVKEPWDTGGGPVRTLFRFLCFGAGAVCLLRWRRARDSRLLPLALLLGTMLLLSYAGGILWLTRQVQPYRHVAPALLAAALPAAVLLGGLLRVETIRALGAPARVLLALALLLLLPRAIGTVLFYLPQALPVARKPVPGMNPSDPPPEPTTGLYGPRPLPLSLYGVPDDYKEVARWLEARQRASEGRVLVQDWMMAEHLQWAGALPILGGLDERNLHHVDAHLFRWYPDGKLPGKQLRDYLERYAVRHVVVRNYKPALEWRKDLLEFKALVGGNRIYRTKITPSYFLRGEGEVHHQALNLIRVRLARRVPEVVLRFHYMETLRCRPGCRVERFAVEGDRVGFLRVPDPPPAFDVYNSYVFLKPGS